MRRSHSLQLFAAITAFLVIITFLLFSAHAKDVSNDNYIQLTFIFAIAALGGSFGGTTLFWLLFQCDFARAKKMRNMNKRIEEAQSNIKETQSNVEKAQSNVEKAQSDIKEIQSNFKESKKDTEYKFHKGLQDLETNIKKYIDDLVKKIGSDKDSKSGNDQENSPDKESPVKE